MAFFGAAKRSYERSELRDKPIWATLQALDGGSRDFTVAAHEPVVLTETLSDGIARVLSDTDLRIVRLPRRDGQAGFVWIVSNTTTNSDSLFVMPPDTAFDLNCEDLEDFSATTDIVPPVQAFLQQACR